MTPAVQLSLPGQVASQAEFIVDNLQHTFYQHTDKIDVDRGIYDCDCNGFVAFVLQRAAPAHFSPIPKESTQPRPRAFEYFVFFDSLSAQPVVGWHRIMFLKDVRRGDIIAWRFAEVVAHHDTGHVLIAAGTPTVNDAGIFTVHLYDSADKPHFDDTRGSSQGQFKSGVGFGSINFKVDKDGRPVSYQFAPPLSSSFATHPIAIGRLEPLPALT